MIVPFAVGGPADITGRIIADVFTRHLGQRVIVENINGAGGTIGAVRAARATPDGYTIFFGHTGTNALAPAFYPDIAYDPQKDFEPIGLTAEYPEVLVVRKDLPAKNLGEFVCLCQGQPEQAQCRGTPASARYPISDVCCSTRRWGSSRP
ncbi:MAG: tripartite tricarboxylate transporter substrate-binding protein [Bradyrhizobium sp.]